MSNSTMEQQQSTTQISEVKGEILQKKHEEKESWFAKKEALKKDIQEANITIAHEIIHLLIYSQAKRLKLDYKKTEGVVDLFFKKTSLKKIFPKYKSQKGVIHSEKLFNQLAK